MLLWVQGLSKTVGVRCEKCVLKPLEPVGLRKGKEVRIRIMRIVWERLRDFIGVLIRNGCDIFFLE